MLYDKFVQCLTHLQEISDCFHDGWKLKKYEDNVFLVKSATQTIKEDDRDSLDRLLSSEVDHQTVCLPSVAIRRWEYHILYSLSYSVPVLYFNVWKSTGELLTLEELWQAVNPIYRQQVVNNKWFTLTQQEHPYISQPFFYFHPCNTKGFIDCLNNGSSNVLITWLSSIGQIIWLEMSEIYGKYCNFDDWEKFKLL